MPENAPWEYSLPLPNDVRAVTVSRRTLRLMLTMHGLIGLVDVAELLATELVSNAVRHTKGPAALRVHWSPPGTLRIGAWDADPRPPEPPQPFSRRQAGRTGEGWRWCGPVPTRGGGSPWPGTAAAASTCAVSWLLRERREAGVPVFLSHDPDDFAALPKDGEFWDWAGGPGRGRGGRPGARPGAAAKVARGTGPPVPRLGAHEAAAAEEALPASLRGGPRGGRARSAGRSAGRCRPGGQGPRRHHPALRGRRARGRRDGPPAPGGRGPPRHREPRRRVRGHTAVRGRVLGAHRGGARAAGARCRPEPARGPRHRTHSAGVGGHRSPPGDGPRARRGGRGPGDGGGGPCPHPARGGESGATRAPPRRSRFSFGHPHPLARRRVIDSNPSCNRFHEEVERRWRASRTSLPRRGCPWPR